MSFHMRQSKFRHVFGTPAKKENAYEDIKLTRSAWDSNFLACNPDYFAVCWEAGGGGTFAVIPYERVGKQGAGTPLFAGHKGAVLDLDFNPFNDSIIASASEDCTVKIWNIPQGGPTETCETPLVTLKGHQRKVGKIHFHPAANNVLLSGSTDLSLRLWDVEAGSEKMKLDGHTDAIQDLDWFKDGQYIITSCKDKKVRIFDPRTGQIIQEGPGHAGIKGSRIVDVAKGDMFFSVGFGKSSDRQFHMYDMKNLEKPIHKTDLDQSSGIIMPFMDQDTGVLFLAGKGDGNIRYYEVTDAEPYLFFLSEYKSNHPQRGMGAVPKRACDVHSNEITRLLKLEPNRVEPLHFRVPRKSDLFQDDLFPPAFSGEPTMTCEEWLGGKNEPPKRMSMEPTDAPKEKKVVQEFKVSDAAAAAQAAEDAINKMKPDELRSRVSSLQKEVAAKDTKIAELEAKLAALQAE